MTTHSKLLLFVSLLFLCHGVSGWIHNLELENDDRETILLTRPFGFLKYGTLAVYVNMSQTDTKSNFSFILNKSNSPGLSSSTNHENSLCAKDREHGSANSPVSSVLFKLDFTNKRLVVTRKSDSLSNLTIVDTPHEEYLFQNNLAHGVYTYSGKAETEPATAEKGNSSAASTRAGANDAKDGNSGSTKGDDKAQASDGAVKANDEDKVNKPAGENDDKGAKDGNKDDNHVRRGHSRERRETDKAEDEKSTKTETETAKASERKPEPGETVTYLKLNMTENGGKKSYQTYFLVHVKTEEEEGLYSLFFVHCGKISPIDLSLRIIQDNNGNYLSADEMPIPALYFLFSVVFFILTVVWISVLRKADEGVYKIHYLMLVVIIFKCLSDLFHGVNMHMIQKSGIHVDAWAILWYIVYLMKGAVMFVTVLLIGAGWAFIKHVFTDGEKKLFLIVIPLQILMNVAWVIMEEREEGYSSYSTWHTIFIVVDLMCCLAILFPVIWSIRHLQEASKTDGKAAINLNKLKLFRHFYVMVVAYIYFTRIIGYLLVITLPFRYGWMKDLFEEVFLLVFFTMTGYKFRPTSDNPYLQVPQDSDDEEIEMDEVVTKTGNMDSVVRVNQGRGTGNATATVKQRESSHEYD